MQRRKEDRDARTLHVDDKHFIRINMLTVGGLLLLLLGFVWGQIEDVREELDDLVAETEARFDNCRVEHGTSIDALRRDFELAISGKADKSQAEDRYTGQVAVANNARLNQRIDDIQTSFQEQINHIHDMMQSCK